MTQVLDQPETRIVDTLPALPAFRLEPRPIPLALALLGAWFRPRYTGPHLAAGSWVDAIVAHLFGIIGITFLFPFLMIYSENTASGNPSVERLTVSIYVFWERSLNFLDMPDGTLILLAVLLSVEASCLAVALSLMPWAAAGESAGKLFVRCYKWVLWGSSLSVPVLLAIFLGMLLTEWAHGEAIDTLLMRNGPFSTPILMLAGYACCWWIVAVFSRGLLDYAGPAEGPGWEPIEPICEGCGYRLAFQSPMGICPECAKPVVESLPGGDRGPASYANRPNRRAGGISLTLELFFGRPLAHIPCRSRMPQARRFCFQSSLFMLVPLHLFMPVTATVIDDSLETYEIFMAIFMFGAVFGSLLLEFLLGSWFLCFLAGWWQDKKCDPRIPAGTALFCTALLWPLVIGFVLGLGGMITCEEFGVFDGAATLFGLRRFDLYALSWSFIGLCWTAWWLLRMRTHVRSIRHCNS